MKINNFGTKLNNYIDLQAFKNGNGFLDKRKETENTMLKWNHSMVQSYLKRKIFTVLTTTIRSNWKI